MYSLRLSNHKSNHDLRKYPYIRVGTHVTIIIHTDRNLYGQTDKQSCRTKYITCSQKARTSYRWAPLLKIPKICWKVVCYHALVFLHLNTVDIENHYIHIPEEPCFFCTWYLSYWISKVQRIRFYGFKLL